MHVRMNPESEIRNGFYISGEIKEIWNIQLDLASKLFDVCKRHNLKIWAEAGTLLGAVRHKGYIPWDDDMDFAMLRSDYDKLITLADEFEDPYFLQCTYTDRGYARGHIQLRNSRTAAILPCDIWQSFNQGVFIDIFVLDEVSINREIWEPGVTEVNKRLSRIRQYSYQSLLNKNFKSFRKLFKTFIYFKSHSIREEFRLAERAARSIPHGENSILLDAMFCFDPSKAPLRKKEWFNEVIWVPFEDILIPIPSGYDEDLTEQYGDYLTPVKAPTSHGNVIFDTRRPYTAVLKEMRAKLPLKERLRGRFIPARIRL